MSARAPRIVSASGNNQHQHRVASILSGALACARGRRPGPAGPPASGIRHVLRGFQFQRERERERERNAQTRTHQRADAAVVDGRRAIRPDRTRTVGGAAARSDLGYALGTSRHTIRFLVSQNEYFLLAWTCAIRMDHQRLPQQASVLGGTRVQNRTKSTKVDWTDVIKKLSPKMRLI